MITKSVTKAMPRLHCLLMRTPPYDFNVRYNKGSTNLLEDCLLKLYHYRTKSSYLLSKFMKEYVGYKPQPAKSSCCKRPLHIMICFHSNSLCNMVSQPKYKKCPWKSNHSGISVKKSLLKMVFYTKGQE